MSPATNLYPMLTIIFATGGAQQRERSNGQTHGDIHFGESTCGLRDFQRTLQPNGLSECHSSAPEPNRGSAIEQGAVQRASTCNARSGLLRTKAWTRPPSL
jgi:hypothetical protein